MTNRQKVIKGLECCRRGFCFACPYNDDIDENTDCKQRWADDALALLKAQESITGETSDGYHTFNELYHHRAVLFSVIVANYPDRAWKSKKHHDGTMYNGMFIVGIDTPDGQATYHYDVDPYWDMFGCRVLDNAPEWDGHTPAQAIERIGKLKARQPRVMTLEEVKASKGADMYLEISARTDEIPYITAATLDGVGTKGVTFYCSHFDFVAYNRRLYGWRCWASRPEEKVRADTPWADN